MITRFADIHRPDCEQRPFTPHMTVSRFGQTSIEFVCPFCQANVTAYVWSLPNGKRCTCGAIFGRRAGYKIIEGQKR